VKLNSKSLDGVSGYCCLRNVIFVHGYLIVSLSRSNLEKIVVSCKSMEISCRLGKGYLSGRTTIVTTGTPTATGFGCHVKWKSPGGI
jgi:hypothetical protein